MSHRHDTEIPGGMCVRVDRSYKGWWSCWYEELNQEGIPDDGELEGSGNDFNG